MEVKIFTEGGNDIGFGHISRCSSLYDEALNRKVNVKFFIYGDINSVEFLKSKEVVNVNWMDENYLKDNIKDDDYVIVDSYVADIQKYEIISQKSKKALYIDDNGRLNYPKGIIVNPSLDSSHIDYSHSSNIILLSGPEYVILRDPFKGVKRENISKEVKKVLIVMGGTDIRGLIPLIIDNICRNRLDIEFDIVTGSEDMEKINSQISKPNNIIFHKNLEATQMMELMISSDLAITAAGQTIYELLATQTPFIPIQVVENQKITVSTILKKKIVRKVISWSSKNISEEIIHGIEFLKDEMYRKKYILNNANLIDGKGSGRIIDELMR